MKAGGRHRPGRVRIVGGTLRGSVLPVPEHAGLRPTPVRIRETLFNWLQADVVGACCLDLFAGSGALGIEALSRGAAQVSFVERDPGLAKALRAALERLHQPHAQVSCVDALGWLAAPPEHAHDLVFLDPPFGAKLWTVLAQALEAPGWLAPHARIHVELPPDAEFSPPPAWHVQRRGRAGDVMHVLYGRDAVIG